MKILLYAPRFHTNLYFVVKALLKDRNEVKVVVSYRGRSENYDTISPTVVGYSSIYKILSNVIYTFKKNDIKGNWDLKLSVPNIKKLFNIIRRYKPDILLLKDYLSVNLLITIIITKLLKIDTIILTQTSKNKIFGSVKLLQLYLKYLKYMGVKGYITPTKRTKHALLSVGEKKVYYIPFIYDVKNFKKYYFNKGRINILTVGKFIIRKDHLLLLKSVLVLSKKYKLHLTIVGEKMDDECLKQILNYIRVNKMQKYTNIKYNITHNTMLKLYRNYDIFVLPSYSEPAAYSIVEAMANKLPIICSNENGTKCYVKNGYNGYVFKAKRLNSLIINIKNIISNKTSLILMGNNSFTLVSKYHSYNNFLYKFYESIK